MNIQYHFENRNVVVTGGAQGIGLQIARNFLKSGAKVSIWDYSQESLNTAQRELSQWKESLQVARVDVSNFTSCQTAAKSMPFPVHILINNAGITRDKSFAKMTDTEFQAVIQTNLAGVFNATKSLYENFDPASTSKRIISISSVVALYGNFGQTNYAAAKAGVIGITKTLSRELAKKGFTVNAIAPGFTRTKMLEAMPQDILDQMAAKVPVARLGTTEDIANACLFLASDEASYINGAVLSVDGGLVC